ncbi:hypothetical protein JKF63_00449 [Porcisia hertigi]|uniref:Uncharacterized protein n=1 Tax=Porcisia hertigi TaxID=2761500 RepID=A0A836HF48_9TRYP|nr:hypothetical protein JKF63_00449 [Porcisia hertigi]
MTSKEELAALMASEGDFEKKISLLKRAVVRVTKQRQEAEARQSQLQEELSTATQQLEEAQRVNATLQRKVKSLEAQREHEPGSGSAFGQNVLKGLSSIMGNIDSAGRVDGRGGCGASREKLSLSQEDVERLISENEQLHRQMYTLKTKLEDTQRSATNEAERLRSEVGRLQGEVQELRSSLETTTTTLDSLRAEYLTERALGDFCRHFFVASLRQAQQERASSVTDTIVEVRWPARGPSSDLAATPFSDPSPAVVRERTVHTLQSSVGTLKTLLHGISALAVVLKEKLPLRKRATVGDLECLRDRLSIFLEAHMVKKARLMHLLEKLDSPLSALQHAGEEGSCSALVSTETFVEAQDEIVQAVLEWVGFLRSQLPLLVECCVSFLPHSHVYTLHTAYVSCVQGNGAAASPQQAIGRGEFVEVITRHGYAALASIEGSLMAMRMLVQRSPAAYRHCDHIEVLSGVTSAPTTSRETLTLTSSSETKQPPIALSSLLALQQFWWEGCASVRSMHSAIQVLNGGLADIADACNKSEVRDTLHYLRKCLQTMAVDSGEIVASSEAALADAEAAVDALSPGTIASRMPAHASSGDGALWMSRPKTECTKSSSVLPTGSVPGVVYPENYEELLIALSAADRAAASYYTQMNHLYAEMAEKEDAEQTALEAVTHLQQLIEAERAEAKHTHHALQSQISLLSTQLVEMAEASATQALQY